MTRQTVTGAVAKRDENEKQGAAALVEQYRGDFATVLPSHIKTETWVRLAVGALRRDPALLEAANNDPYRFLAVLLEAARKGLEPGTEQYYLIPRKERGVSKVQGIEGYQGIVERIYRAGAVSSVVVEVVRQKDGFSYRPGRDERPIHDVDWDAEDRGALRLVYAYCVMRDRATSKVVVLNKAKVMEAKAKSDGAKSDYSPWNTHEEAMWLKTAARRLEKWVPTSSEYLAHQLKAAVEADNLRRPTTEPAQPATPSVSGLAEAEPVDAEVVEDADPQPEPTEG
ncbi:MAG: recombinase RecT [Actinomycetes bacterium]